MHSTSDQRQTIAIESWIQQTIRHRDFNRNVTFTFDWHASRVPENWDVARGLMFEFLWRVARRIHGYRRTQIATEKLLDFIAMPEYWKKSGARVPLHYHSLLTVPDSIADWFDRDFKGAGMLWQKIAMDGAGLRSRIHIQTVNGVDGLAYYNTKHSDDELCFSEILLPLDFAAFRAKHYGARAARLR